MNEFSLIEKYFKALTIPAKDVLLGIGDDAACIHIEKGKNLLISTDTSVAGTHFLSTWDPYDIAYKALMVNISDIAAMGGIPWWITLALTLPDAEPSWLERFSSGLKQGLEQFNIALVGGDTTRGPLNITITIFGLVEEGKEIRRSGAKVGDKIYLSGSIGAAALAVSFLDHKIDANDQKILMDKLQKPTPRTDLQPLLNKFATSAVDISDGLSADLNHICVESKVGAIIDFKNLPIHPLVKKYQGEKAIEFAITGGDDYELCFTVSEKDEQAFLKEAAKEKIKCYSIGEIEAQNGLRAKIKEEVRNIKPHGYQHF